MALGMLCDVYDDSAIWGYALERPDATELVRYRDVADAAGAGCAAFGRPVRVFNALLALVAGRFGAHASYGSAVAGA